MRAHSLTVAAHALSFVTATLIACPAVAQFKWVGPNGTVTYSDQPPPTDARGAIAMSAPKPRSDGAPDGALPYALRDAAAKYPVVLFVTNDCAPCQQARSHLVKRGIPFAERAVKTTADADAFKRLGFNDNSFPAMSVGRDRTTGFESAAWDIMLTAAGYPEKSALPPNYRHAPAKTLAAQSAPKALTGTNADASNDAGGVVDGTPTEEASAGDASREPPRNPARARQSAQITPPPAPRAAPTLRF